MATIKPLPESNDASREAVTDIDDDSDTVKAADSVRTSGEWSFLQREPLHEEITDENDTIRPPESVTSSENWSLLGQQRLHEERPTNSRSTVEEVTRTLGGFQISEASSDTRPPAIHQEVSGTESYSAATPKPDSLKMATEDDDFIITLTKLLGPSERLSIGASGGQKAPNAIQATSTANPKSSNFNAR